MRDPGQNELKAKPFNAVWECIKKWDISTEEDVLHNGTRLYSGATGNHVCVILDALREQGFSV